MEYMNETASEASNVRSLVSCVYGRRVQDMKNEQNIYKNEKK